MKKFNRIISFILALVILLGSVSTSALAYSKESLEKDKEVNYERKTIEGRVYKAYKFNDLIPEDEKNFKTINIATRSAKTKKQVAENVINNTAKATEIVSEDDEQTTTSNTNDLLIEDELSTDTVSDGTRSFESEDRMAEDVADVNMDVNETTQLGDSIEKTNIDVKWTTYDLNPNDISPEGIYFEIFDWQSKKIIARTDKILGKGKYEFHKLLAFDDSDVSKNREDWELIIPDNIYYDVRLHPGDNGAFDQYNVTANFAQVAIPLYKVVFETIKTPYPNITVRHNNKNNKLDNEKVINENLKENQYYSLMPNTSSGVYYNGNSIEIVGDTGNENDISRKVSDSYSAARYYMVIKAGNMSDFNKTKNAQGSFIDNDINYHYKVTGDHKTPHIATIKEEVKVYFDPNGGKWNDSKNENLKEYPFGYNMTLGQSWGDIEAITPPVKEALIPPTTNPDEPEKEFKGWSKDSKGPVITDMLSELITGNTTFYAIYDDTDQGTVNIKYTDENGKDIIIEDNKIENQVYKTSKSGTLGKLINKNDFSKKNAPQFKNYNINEVKIPENSTYKDNNQDTITYVYKLKDTCLAIHVDSSSQEYDEKDNEGVFVDRQYIKGTVLDVGNKKPSKEILKDATVIIVDADGNPIKDRDGSNIPAAKVKDDGTFEFTISQKGVEKLKLDHNNTIYFAVECKENGSAKPKGQAELTLDLQAPSLTKVN